jgi:ATP-binding cassette subfamily B protein
MLVGMIVIMLFMNWQLTLLAIAPAPFFIVSTMRISQKIREAALRQRHRQGAMAATAAESMSAIRVVQALSLENIFADSFNARSQQDQSEEIKGSKLSARLGRTVDALIAVSSGITLWYGARLVLREHLTAGELWIFLSYLKTAFRPIRDFAKYAARIAKASAAGERVLDVLDRTPEVRNLPGAVPAPKLRGEVRFENLNFEYEPGHRVLRNIDFVIEPGQHVSLVGPSGIGKSTMVSLILRLYDPIEGRVLIDGRDIREYTLESLRAQISVVLQDTILFASTARDNLAYGVPGATRDEIEHAARLANAHEFILALPEGYDTVLGERGVTLSTGQRQRIAIARAAIRQSPILILDEPTTGLDRENEQAVVDAFDKVSAGRTTFLISHDLRHTSQSELILYLDKGRIHEFGSHDDLISSNGRYAHLYRNFLVSQDA